MPDDDPIPAWLRRVEFAIAFGVLCWYVWMVLPESAKWSVKGWAAGLGQRERVRRAQEEVARQMGWETHSVIVELDKGGDDLADRLEVA